MGYTTRKHSGGTIESFWPDDTDTEFYISRDASLAYIIERVEDLWPDADFSDIQITSEFIHTDSLGYDLFDRGDWDEFLKISYEGQN